MVEELPQEDRAWLQRILDKGAVLDTDESAETPKIVLRLRTSFLSVFFANLAAGGWGVAARALLREVLGSPASITLPRAETKEAMLDYVLLRAQRALV